MTNASLFTPAKDLYKRTEFNGKTFGSGNEHHGHRTSWAHSDGDQQREVSDQRRGEPASAHAFPSHQRLGA